MKKPPKAELPKQAKPAFIDHGDGIDWGAELRHVEEHWDDPAIVKARQTIEKILQKHGFK